MTEFLQKISNIKPKIIYVSPLHELVIAGENVITAEESNHHFSRYTEQTWVGLQFNISVNQASPRVQHHAIHKLPYLFSMSQVPKAERARLKSDQKLRRISWIFWGKLKLS